MFNSTELHFSKFTSFKIGTLVPSLKIADDFYGWLSIALDLMRPSFWGHLAMTINNIQTSRNWTRLTQSDQWCQQRQSNQVKRKNMDKTHQSCLFTKYQKGQLVKKRGLMTIAFFMRCQRPIQNYETANFVHQWIYSRSCKSSIKKKKISSALSKIKHNQPKRNGYFRNWNWLLRSILWIR